MEIIKLYKFIRPEGGVTVSPVMPEGKYTEMVRLVADEHKLLTKDGENLTSCIDTETSEDWYEVDALENEEAEQLDDKIE